MHERATMVGALLLGTLVWFNGVDGLTPTANAGATSQKGSVFDTMAAMNAENLAKKEGKSLVGKELGLKKLTMCSTKLMQEKGPVLAKLIEREGCVGLPDALTAETCGALKAWIDGESERAKAEVLDGRAPFDARFGGVNQGHKRVLRCHFNSIF